MRELAAQFLALAEKQGAAVPLMVGHRNMGVSLLHTGDIEVALWPLGYPEAALADAHRAVRDAREIGQAASLMAALTLHR